MGQQNDGDTISRRMAIDAMATTLFHYPIECLRNINKYEFAKGLAELGLKSLPSAKPEPCDDVVSRKAVEHMLQNGLPARGMWEIEGDVVKQTVCETLADALMDLEKLPSAQPEIIRCKDCKNWDKTWTNDFSPNYHYCPMVDGVRKDNFYCADAERREE